MQELIKTGCRAPSYTETCPVSLMIRQWIPVPLRVRFLRTPSIEYRLSKSVCALYYIFMRSEAWIFVVELTS